MKILILRPQDMCYGILDHIANNFGYALSNLGIEVYDFDLKEESIDHLGHYVTEELTAVIDVYSGLLSVRTQHGEYLWNCIDAPVFQICVDYPIYVRSRMDARLNKYYALCLDRHYCEVIKEYMPNITDTYFFPMAGKGSGKKTKPWEKRDLDIVFIGTYTNYRKWFVELNQCEEGIRKIGYTFFCTMRDHVEYDQKQAFEIALAQLGIHISNEELYQWLQMVSGMALAVTAYYRENLIKELLQAGLTVEVYGDSWIHSPLAEFPNLRINEQLDEEQYIFVLERAKVSLNIMYCNKSGYSERYSYTMLNGAVCVSDESEYLKEEFIDGENIVFYQLDQLCELPKKIKWLLEHPVEAQKIADAAYHKAVKEHTWEERADRFMNILRKQI